MSEQPEDREQRTEDRKSRAGSPRHGQRAILLIAIVIAVGVFVFRNIEATKNILLVLLGFGAVIIIHEFGHFVAAKLGGIKVEAFSIFMPPTLFGIKKADRGWRIRILPELLKKEKENKEGTAVEEEPQGEDEGLYSFTFGRKLLPGETEYRIGLIPLGGYVKMLGQEDVGPVKENQDPRSFANKPALVRAAVLAAGVTFNVISAVIVYVIVFLAGIDLVSPVVGGVIPGSPADKAGIVAGDEIIEIAGQDGRLDYSDVKMAAVLSARGEAVPVKVRRQDGSVKETALTAEHLAGEPFRDFGIERAYTLTIEQLAPKGAALLKEATGLTPGDRIKAVGGADINNSWEFERIIKSVFEPNVSLLAQRKDSSGQTKLVEGHVDLAFPAYSASADENEANLPNIRGMIPRMRITAAQGTFKDRLRRVLRLKERDGRLKPGDIIAAVANVGFPTYSEMRELTNEYEDKTLVVTVLRSEPNKGESRLAIPVVPKRDKDANRVVIGIGVALDVEHAVVAKTIATSLRNEAPARLAEDGESRRAIPRGAFITAVDGVEVSNFFDIAEELKKNTGRRVTIDWRLDEQNAGNTAIEVEQDEQIAAVRTIPKQLVPFKQLERLYKADGPIDALMMGYRRTRTFVVQSYLTLLRLFGGLVSPKGLMGPVGILTMSYKIVADHPLVYYVYFLGLISASLAVLNFLPMPPLDGGLIVLLLIEKIKGSALSMRTQEWIAYVGWGLVLALMLYVTVNDISRLIFG